MKLSLCIWLIVLIACPWLLAAQNSSFSLYLLNTQNTRKLDQSFIYTFSPYRAWNMNFTGSSLVENRLNFDQTGKVTQLNMELLRNGKILSHSIASGFEYLYDASNLESELKPYKNRTGYTGYSFTLNPLDSLNLSAGIRGYYRDEQDRYMDNRTFISQGFDEQVSGFWHTGDYAKSLSLNANWQNKELNWEAYNQYSAGINGSYDNETLVCNAAVNAGKRFENIYTLSAPDSIIDHSYYSFADRQSKQYIDTNLLLAAPYDPRFNISASNQYSIRLLRMEQNKTKDNGDYNNLAQVTINYEVMPHVMLQMNAKHTYYIKALNLSKDSRIMESRLADTGIIWDYNQGDSLLVNYILELRRNSYPDDGHQLDNDYLNRMIKVNWTTYWKERIKLRNRLLYLVKDEVFIDSWLSANNNTATSLQWSPECDVVLGDSFLFQQTYQIRADYDDFIYNSFADINDNFYRQGIASYHIIYDSTPLLGRLTDSRWSRLPFRNRKQDAVRCDLNYEIERNETGSKIEEVYYLTSRNDLQTVSVLLQKQYGIGIYQVQPKYTWGNWQEYSLALNVFFQLNESSFAELGINPVGETIDAIDWKVSCTVNLLF